jgi:hypothetical protein
MSFSTLNSKLRQINAELDRAMGAAQRGILKAKAIRGVQLAPTDNIGSIVNGIELLMRHNFDPQSLTTMFPAMGRLTSAAPELSDALKTELPEEQKALFREVTEKEGFGDPAETFDIITAMTPKSVAKDAKSVLDLDKTDIPNLLKSIVGGDVEDLVLEALGTTPMGEFLTKIAGLNNLISTMTGLASGSGAGLMNEIMENVTGRVMGQVGNLADRRIPDNVMSQIYQLISSGNLDDAFKAFSKFSDDPDSVRGAFYGLGAGIEEYIPEIKAQAEIPENVRVVGDAAAATDEFLPGDPTNDTGGPQ